MKTLKLFGLSILGTAMLAAMVGCQKPSESQTQNGMGQATDAPLSPATTEQAAAPNQPATR